MRKPDNGLWLIETPFSVFNILVEFIVFENAPESTARCCKDEPDEQGMYVGEQAQQLRRDRPERGTQWAEQYRIDPKTRNLKIKAALELATL